MATSSITANFVMRDPKVSRAFVRALLARRPSGNVPRIRNDWEVLSDPESIRGFFGRRRLPAGGPECHAMSIG